MPDQLSFEDREDLIALAPHWEKVLDELGNKLPGTVVERFLKPLAPLSFDNDLAVFAAPGAFVMEWVKDKYADMLVEQLSNSTGRRIRLELRVQPRERAEAEATTVSIQASPAISELPTFRPNPKQRFETFVVGNNSKFAFAGCKAVASSPGVKYNPLFIYGPSGMGKTHLLNAIANEFLSHDPRYPIIYMTAQRFTEDFVNALQNNRIDQFRRAQRNVSVWLLDDVQFIAGKDRTQEELFHTFNYLHSLGKQIVLCSDRPPRDLLLMDERLRSRFESGLVADIQMPDTETRCAIVKMKAEQEGIDLSHDIAMCLAEGVVGNVRLLEGALNKVMAQASMEGEQPSVDLAQAIVDAYYVHAGAAKPSFDQIINQVSRHFRIEKDEIKGLSRKAPIAHARHVAVYITREITGDSWKHIGELFGNRDHTSMMHGYRKIREMMSRDRDLNASVKLLMRDLYPDS